ncbi:AAA family ATPase [Pseudomonas sp. DTU_2021_1001937_2_SI_NGA_ILE_001]|uniref:AAA family ATPase n=1 Tax=Pseudomonas sp. DTU_2021_1001937_2_SI_NGA_ILE_001 TaxID=3077589 RepID=UPI0028FC286C|nr:AAA family ATPase [Pseudomonas sp. DTU_2021_1001937_2_SI_NGA_ILE_001]WNW10095.1 AAA family ATPase [Pseudomonas sp. DTU_2021_1001937_2_SI_NGA_ILE_001]
MRIESIYIENFQGLRHADLQLATPITLVCGHNGVGKSSLRDAIALAFGEGARVQHKKDWAQLVTEGQKKGQVIIGHDGVASSITLPAGKGERAPVDGQEFLPFVLAPEAFARLDDKAKRSLLMSLTKASAKPAIIVEKLAARGADAAKVEKIKPLLLSGFAAGQEQAKTYASESRGAWKAITGEAYGSEKAEGWTYQVPESEVDVSPEAIDAVIAEHAQYERLISEGTAWVGAQDEKRRHAAGFAQRKADLEAAAGLLPRAIAKREATQKDLDSWQPKLEDLQVRLREAQAGAGGCNCPECGTSLKIVGSKLEKYDGLVADTSATQTLAAEVQKAREAVDLYRRTLTNDIAAVTAAEHAQADLAKLGEQQDAEGFDQEKYDASIGTIQEFRVANDQRRAKINAMKERQDELKNAGTNTTKAAGHHQDVKDWTLIEKALAPDGIPGEILAGALAPVNDQLKRLCKLSGWLPMEIGADMAITAGGRLYQLLSESEKWRCDAHIALTVALLSGLRMVVLDRADVLLPAVRAKHLGMLQVLAKAGEIETAIVCGSLKEKPAALPPEFTAVWVENGLAGEPPLQQAS